MWFRRWRGRKAADDAALDARTREENETFRAQHDGAIVGQVQPAADRWQKRTEDEFKRPSY